MPKSEAASLDGATMRSMSVKLDGYHGTIYETEGNVVASIATSKRDDYEGVTAEAIGIDSTRQEVEDSYPDLIVGKIDEKGTQYLTVFQKGWPSALRLRFDWSPEQRKAGASVEEGDVPEMLFRMSLSCGYVPPASATVPSGS